MRISFLLLLGDYPDITGARFGKVPTKKQTVFGYKPHLLVTLGGVILDLELAPANARDLTIAFERLSQHSDLDVLGDRAYRGPAIFNLFLTFLLPQVYLDVLYLGPMTLMAAPEHILYLEIKSLAFRN